MSTASSPHAQYFCHAFWRAKRWITIFSCEKRWNEKKKKIETIWTDRTRSPFYFTIEWFDAQSISSQESLSSKQKKWKMTMCVCVRIWANRNLTSDILYKISEHQQTCELRQKRGINIRWICRKRIACLWAAKTSQRKICEMYLKLNRNSAFDAAENCDFNDIARVVQVNRSHFWCICERKFKRKKKIEMTEK